MIRAIATLALLTASPVALALPSPMAPAGGADMEAFYRHEGRAACGASTPLSTTGPNILLVGDSISMGSSGYSLFVQDMMQTATGGAFASVQHGGGFGGGGQMASSANGAAKMQGCMGNATGTLKPHSWSVITYNAGLHDCDTTERVHADAYRANLKAIFGVMKQGAAKAVFVTTTPYDIEIAGKVQFPAGINMSCVLEYNVIAKEVAAEVGDVEINDLWQYVEDFCKDFPQAAPPYAGNYTSCAVQTTGLHFFNRKPFPSGQQYTGISVAETAMKLIPKAEINNKTTLDLEVEAALDLMAKQPDSCGNAPAPLSTTLPNVLIIGDSISMPGSGYGPGVETILMQPGIQHNDTTRGPIASVQHNGGKAGTLCSN